jgi:hypothetical protein
MKRTTVMLPDETLARLRQESRMRGTSVAEIVRDAVKRHLAEPEAGGGRRLGFIGVIEGGPSDIAENFDEYFAEAMRDRWG